MTNVTDSTSLIDLDALSETIQPYARLKLEPQAIAETSSMVFRKGFDGLDYLVFSEIAIDGAEPSYLVRHDNAPEAGTLIYLEPQQKGIGSKLFQVLKVLGLNWNKVDWLHPDLEHNLFILSHLSMVTQENFSKADNLIDAFRACDLTPLQGKTMDRYYVDLKKVRKTKAINGVNARLKTLGKGEYATLLFTGHRGCGKSTELHRIQDRWAKQYRIVYLEVDALLDINNLEYVDLYLAIIKQIADDLSVLQIQFDPELLASFEKWFQEITEETEKTLEGSIALEVEAEAGFQVPFISKLLTKVLGQLKNSSTHRETIRTQLKRDISRLQSDINLLLSDAHDKLTKDHTEYKGFLIIVDNLDRVSVNVAKHLYFDFGAQLQSLNCTIIYTVPINVIYPNQEAAQNAGLKLSSIFESPNIMPMVNIYDYDPAVVKLTHNSEALDAVGSLIHQRVEVSQIFEQADDLTLLAQASGGHVRQLMQLFRAACLSAIGEDREQLSQEDIEYAIKQAQFEFERLIPREQYAAIAQVCEKKDFQDESVRASLLHSTAVLEYNGNARWNYPNPVVMHSKAFQEALEDLKSKAS